MNFQTSLVAEQVRLHQWADQIQSCQRRSSDMKITTWCAQNGIIKATYYYRLKRVREACLIACDNPKSTFVELPISEHSTAKDVSISNDKTAAIVRMSSDISIELLNSASPEFLRSILGACAYAK